MANSGISVWNNESEGGSWSAHFNVSGSCALSNQTVAYGQSITVPYPTISCNCDSSNVTAGMYGSGLYGSVYAGLSIGGSTFNQSYTNLRSYPYSIGTTISQAPTTATRTVSAGSIFNSSNRTLLSVPIKLYMKVTIYHNSESRTARYKETSFSSYDFDTAYTVTLNAPPTFTTSQVYADTGLTIGTVAKVDVSSLSAKYGGTISEVLLTIGEQTATTTTAGTMSITLDTVGVFIPTVKVTDSRGQETTKTLNTIIVRSELPTWVEPVADRANSKTRTTATDMTRIASDCAYLGGQNETTEYSLGDFVAESEWNKIVSFAQTLDATITSSTDYLNLNKMELAFKNAHDEL